MYTKDESAYMNLLVTMFFTVLITFLILLAVGYFLSFVPNEISYEYIKTTFFVDINDFKPEAPERLKYIVLTVLFPILFITLFGLISKLKPGYLNRKLTTYLLNIILFLSELWLLSTILVSLIEIRLLSYNNIPTISNIFLIIISFVFLLILIYFSRRNNFENRTGINSICLMLCILAAIFLSSIYVRTMYGFNYYEFYNFDAYYYPVFEVFYGKILAIDFHNNYGFYPYILVPLLKLAGTITIFKFSLSTAIMVFIVLMSFLYVIWTSIRNKILGLTGYLALLSCYVILPLQLTHRFYLAYLPHRVLFPAILIAICNLYLHSPKIAVKKISVALGYVITCLSIIWNFDTGFVVAGAWCLFLLYIQAIKYSLKDLRFYIQGFKYIGLSILSVACAFIIIFCITYFKSGTLPFINNLFFAQSIFYKYGFFMEPMPKYHVWVILVFIYAIGLIIPLRKIVSPDIHEDDISSIQASIFFVLSVMGMGIFSYYQGRSLDPVLLAVTWPGIIMAILLTQYCYDRAIVLYKSEYIQKKQLYVIYTLQSCSFIIILIPLFLAFPNNIICDNYFRPMRGLTYDTYYSIVNERYHILDSNINRNDDVDLVLLQPAYYYTMLGMKNPTNVGSSVDWFTRADYDKALTWLRTTNNVVILDDNMKSKLANYNKEEFDNIMNGFTMKNIGAGLYMCTRP